jgi:DNA repair protein RecO (recombination protein O)
MRQLATTGIILSRTDYGEADRILTMLTPEYGKLRLVARGVRRLKSKLAGGIELFSVSDITFIKGRGELGTLVSSRLKKHYGHIVKDLNRTMLAYELIKQLHKLTEDEAEPEYFELLQGVLEGLDDAEVSPALVQFWFTAQLLRLGGHMPNLEQDTTGKKLQADERYDFNLDRMTFALSPDRGRYTASHIKFLRLAFSAYPPKVLAHVQGAGELYEATQPLMLALGRSSLHP